MTRDKDHAVLTATEAAAELRMGRSTFYDWINSGTCPLTILRTGRTIRISRAQLNRYMAGELTGGGQAS